METASHDNQETIDATKKKSCCLLEPKRLARPRFPLHLLCIFAGAVMCNETRELLEYWHLMQSPKYHEIWGHSLRNEISRLAQEMPGCVEGTKTRFFLNKEQVPQDRF